MFFVKQFIFCLTFLCAFENSPSYFQTGYTHTHTLTRVETLREIKKQRKESQLMYEEQVKRRRAIKQSTESEVTSVHREQKEQKRNARAIMCTHLMLAV